MVGQFIACTYIKMIPLHAKALKVSSVEHQGSKVFINRLNESLGRAREGQVCYWNIGIPLISIDAILPSKRLEHSSAMDQLIVKDSPHL